MTTVIIYSTAALLLILVVVWLARQDRAGDSAPPDLGTNYAQDLLEGSALSLAERLFDPTDYYWLRDKVGFPQLANVLTRSRKQMALRWLRELRRSFDDLVRTPEPTPEGGRSTGMRQSWQLLWPILRFHLLVDYALLVVSVLGPYHRLVPPLDWVPLFSGLGYRKPHLEPADAGPFPK